LEARLLIGHAITTLAVGDLFTEFKKKVNWQ
jgi:hypothetical protein